MDLQDPLGKMGKTGSSEQGTIRILDEPDVIRRKLKTAVTDSGSEVRRGDDKPGVTNLIDILSVATGETPEAIESRYDGSGYGQFKTDVGEALVSLLQPIQQRYRELRADEAELGRLLAHGADKARSVSDPVLAQVYERMGFVTP
jgi:tryptophanyl-tRNA synthetase